MKVLFPILFILIAGLLLHLFLPWWIILPATILAGLLFPDKAYKSFLSGFAGAALLWGGSAVFMNYQNQGILSEKIGVLFGNSDALLLIIITALTGGIIGGLGALTGNTGRALFKK